jgi:hypothetical protein
MSELGELWIFYVERQEDWLAGWSADEGLRSRQRLRAWLGQSQQDPKIWTILISGTADALEQWAALSAIPQGLAACRVIERRPQRALDIPDVSVADYAAVVKQRVESFDRWRSVFAELEPARKAAGIIGVRVSQSPADECEVHLYAFVSSPERYSAFVKSDALRDKLRSGGLIGNADVIMVKHVALQHKPKSH